METIVIFILKAAASGTIGHYLKRGLERIDAGLSQLIEERKPVEEIVKYIEERQIGKTLDQFAGDILDSSIFIPMDRGEAQSLGMRVEFFRQFLAIGYLLSHAWKIDILLPGSLLGSNSLTLFLGADGFSGELKRSGVRLNIPKLEAYEALAIMPVKGTKELASAWGTYKRAFIEAKSASEEYSSIKDIMPNLYNSDVLRNPITAFRIQSVTASAVMYAVPSIAKQLAGNALALDGDRAPLSHWQEGVAVMLRGIQELRGLLYIPASEAETIGQLSEQLKMLIDNVA
jgi:hypothetical protein